jgi:hypothetical protein
VELFLPVPPNPPTPLAPFILDLAAAEDDEVVLLEGCLLGMGLTPLELGGEFA